jgi:hypothetical protein
MHGERRAAPAMADGGRGGSCRDLANIPLAGKSRQLVDGPALPPDPRGLRRRSRISLRRPAGSEPARLKILTVCTLRRSHGPRRSRKTCPPVGFLSQKENPPGNISFRFASSTGNQPVFIFRCPPPHGPIALARFHRGPLPAGVLPPRSPNSGKSAALPPPPPEIYPIMVCIKYT